MKVMSRADVRGPAGEETADDDRHGTRCSCLTHSFLYLHNSFEFDGWTDGLLYTVSGKRRHCTPVRDVVKVIVRNPTRPQTRRYLVKQWYRPERAKR